MASLHRSTNHKLLLTINLSITILGSVLILAFLGIFLRNTYQSSLQMEQENLRSLTSTAASKTQELFGNLLVTLQLLDEWQQDHPDSDPRFDPAFNRLVDLYRASTGNMIDLRMVDKNGGLFYFPSKNLTPLADVSKREYFRAQQNAPTGSLFFAEPVLSQVTGRWGIPISYRMHDNRFGILVVFAVIEFHSFDSLFLEILSYPERSVTLIRDDRMVLERSPFNESFVGKKLPYITSRSGSGTVEIYDPVRHRRSICYQKLDNLPVYVMVSDSFDRILNRWESKAIKQGLATLLILAAFILLNIRQIQLIRINNIIQKQLENAARFDSLTGMKNRRYFLERFAEELERAKREGNSIILLAADIDHFKTVNDRFGHPEGDRIIKRFADVIEENIRVIDISGRMGGEEFAMVLIGATLGDGMEIAERIRMSAEKVTIGDWPGGISIGVAKWKGESETMHELYKRADNALYAAKHAGRNRVVADGE